MYEGEYREFVEELFNKKYSTSNDNIFYKIFINEEHEPLLTKDYQLQNLNNLKRIITKFHKKAGTYSDVKRIVDTTINENTIVVEASHQPNFMPYSGVWRKAFLLDVIRTFHKNKNIFPIFGFFDYNLSTSNLLVQNKLPDINKEGFSSIGVKLLDRDRWRCFNKIKKPTNDMWDKTIRKIINTYKKFSATKNPSIKENLDIIIEELWKSYEKASTLSEINSIFFSRIINRYLKLKVLFFEYSEMHKNNILFKPFVEILEFNNIEKFNKIYNECLDKYFYNSKDIKKIPENLAPFWYHCDCGGKVVLYFEKNRFFGKCRVCDKKYDIYSKDIEYRRVSPRAVTRNIVVSEGFGVNLYVSGSGGGLKYGTIALKISEYFGFRIPRTITWVGKDFYLGKAHIKTIKRLKSFLKIKRNISELSESDIINRIEDKRREIADRARSIDNEKKERKRILAEYKKTFAEIDMISKIFLVVPSMLDIFVNIGFEKVVKTWILSLYKSNIQKKGWFYEINSDFEYSDGAKSIYNKILKLHQENYNIDPLNMAGGIK